MIRLRTLAVVLVTALVALPALAQIPTGTITGTVTDGTDPLPGVTITVTSPALQGSKMTVSSVNGDYIITFLPPGEYTVKFELSGFQTVEATVKVSVSQTTKIDAEMPQAAMTEEIVVTGSYETISTTSTSATTFEQSFIEELPIGRTILSAVALAPGAHATGPGGQITIQGAQSHENQYSVNGVIITENIRGQPFDLFIEDAIQETTTQTAGISAEYGRFSGGIINTITKSGGNEMHGSFRTNFSNDAWIEQTPEKEDRLDEISKTYEGTLGGWILKDRLWYFGAARDRGFNETRTTRGTNLSYPYENNEQRYEGKLTFAATQSHRFVGSYLKIAEEEIGRAFGSVMDLASLYDREMPQELMAFNYTGVLSDNFFVEAQYSKRDFAFVGSGGKYTDLIRGTMFVNRSGSWRWHAPTFCGVCDDELRNNEDILLKGTYFLSTESLGSHDIVAGYDSFNDIRKANNHQTASDYRVYISGYIIDDDGETIYPVFRPGHTYLQWNPILEGSKGTDFRTNSFFVNDRWRLNENWSFSLGLRYDQNDGVDSADKKISDDSRLSPRLGITWDPKGDGDLIFTAGYGHYVNALANSVADDSAAAGNPAQYRWWYRGPAINYNVGPPYVDADTALQMMWDWFFGYCDDLGCGNESAPTRSLYIPGGTLIIPDALKSPYAEEIHLGATKRLGSRGITRVDYVHREFHDFYMSKTDMETGSTTLPDGNVDDLGWLVNDDSLNERVYDGITVQAMYRMGDRWNFGGNYTWSHAYGNWDGETASSGPVTSGLGDYPEYYDISWRAPRGDLSIDQRHKFRAWVAWDTFVTPSHRLNISLLQNFWSGTPYGAVGSVDPRDYVTNPGYISPPDSRDYWYANRDAFHTDDITSTDIAFNYSFKWKALGADMEIFLQPEVLNVFNEHGVTSVNTTVYDPTDGYDEFNPFTDTPLECPQGQEDCDGFNWQKGPDFGQPEAPSDYQRPRTFRFSVGFRF